MMKPNIVNLLSQYILHFFRRDKKNKTFITTLVV